MAGNNVKTTSATSNKGGMFKFFRDIKGEFKRITWPKKDETKKALIAVLGFAAVYIVLVSGLDYIFQNLFEVVLKLK